MAGSPARRGPERHIHTPPPFVLPVFADDPNQRVYISSALSASTLVAIVGFAVLAAIGG